MTTSTSGILISKFSDHQPYFTCLNLLKKQHKPNKYIKVCKKTPDSTNQFREELRSSNINDLLDITPSSDPNENYNILENIITEAKKKFFPCKVIKFNKYKHKKSPWITRGIIKSIKSRNDLYKRFRSTSSQTAQSSAL